MPVVENTLRLPGKGPAAHAAIHIRLIANTATEPHSGFNASSRVEILGEWHLTADVKGYWSVDLESNSSVTPAGTYYEVVQAPRGDTPVVNTIIVPVLAGPHWLYDLRTTPPAALSVDALAAHIANASDPHAAAVYRFRYVHDQASANALWTVTHNLAGYPSVTVVDSGGNQVEGDLVYVDANTVTLAFAASTGGKAYLS